MKKLTAILLSLALLLSIAACGTNDDVTSSEGTQSKSDETVSDTVSQTVSEEEKDTIPPLDEGIELKVPLLDRDLSQETRVKILPLGDSFTALAPAAYRFYLYEMLYKEGCFFEFIGSKSTSDTRLSDYYTRFEGTGGHTAANGLKVFNEKIKGKMKYDVISLFYGINDVHNESMIPEFEKNYSALLDAIMADNPDVIIYAAGAPKEYTANATKALVEKYQKKGLDITYVNIYQQAHVLFDTSDYVQHTCERNHMLDSGNYKFAQAMANAMKDRISELNKKVPEKKTRIPAAVKNVNLNKTELSLKTGECAEIGYEILPQNADTKSVTWHSSDESIATVNEYGFVTGVKAGETNITAISLDGRAYNVCKVSVSADEFFVPAVDSAMIFSDDFSKADNWDNAEPITKSHNQSVSYDWAMGENVKLKTVNAFDIPENFTLNFTYASSNSSFNAEKANTIEVGNFKLALHKGAGGFTLYNKGAEIASYEGRIIPFVNCTYTLTVKDGKVYVARDNIMLIEKDVTNSPAKSEIKIELNTKVCEFDNLMLTK